MDAEMIKTGKASRLGKRWGSTLLATALVLTACGGSGEDGDSEAGSPTSEITTSPTETSTNGATEEVAFEACEQAADEPSLTWYTAQVPDQVEAALEAYREKYPDVEVEFLRLASGELASRYSSERDAGSDPAGLVTNSAPGFFEAGMENGWFEGELDLPALEAWPDEAYSNGLALHGLLPYYLSYNTDLVEESEAPQDWMDLTDERWQGQITIGDPRTVFGYLALFQILRDEYGDEFLSQLGAQGLNTVPSVVPGSETLAAGGTSIMVPNVPIVTEPLAAEGAPIATIPISPTTGSEFESAVATDTDTSNGAKCLYNFLLTEEGQAAFNGEHGSSVLEDIGSRSIPEGYVTAPFDAAEENEAEILELLGLD